MYTLNITFSSNFRGKHGVSEAYMYFNQLLVLFTQTITGRHYSDRRFIKWTWFYGDGQLA